MPVFHARIVTSDDYVQRRAAQREAHLVRVLGLRSRGLVVAGGPTPDGRLAELIYRAPQRPDVTRLIEEDPYYVAGAWKSYTLRVFSEFIEPLKLPPMVADGSRGVILVEGEAQRADKAKLALIGLRAAGRLGFGGFFDGGATLALLATADAAEARRWLAETGFWDEGRLAARPFLYVL